MQTVPHHTSLQKGVFFAVSWVARKHGLTWAPPPPCRTGCFIPGVPPAPCWSQHGRLTWDRLQFVEGVMLQAGEQRRILAKHDQPVLLWFP